MRQSPLTRTGKPLRASGRIARFGSGAKKWKLFRDEKFKRDQDDEELIRCEDNKIGLPSCGISRNSPAMDLHHSEGRSGKLLFDESKMVWLTRECHQKAHGQE